MRLYHGSSVIVETPKILTNGFAKDFGYGFYCTEKEKQAQKWARTKRDGHVVNIYEYTENPGLNVKHFPEMTDEWLDFIAACRGGIAHPFDIVEGPMADDQVWDYVEDFLRGLVSREAFWLLVKFKYPTHQIAFCTENALQSIRYLEGYSL